MDWYHVKLVAMEATNLSRDALHIFGGLGGQILAAVLLRRTLASPLPWLVVLLVELANEWFDLTYETWRDRPMWPGSIHDIWVTMLVPTLLLLLTRFAAGLFNPPQSAAEPEEPTATDPAEVS